MVAIAELRIIRSDRRSLSLQVEPDGRLIIKAPLRISEGRIYSFVQENREWVKKQLIKIKKRKQLSRQKDEHLFLGKMLTLTPSIVTSITVKDDTLLFPSALLFRKEKELNNWYIRSAKEIITAQVEQYAKEMKTSYREITVSDTRSQWGRCTRDNRLQFSWRLVMAPLLVLRYVVIHELAHITEKNHSRSFWAKVRQFNPSYRQQIKWLKDFGPSLKVA